MKQRSNIIIILFTIAYLLISTIATVLVITSLSFMINIGISSWQFPVSFALTGIHYFFAAKNVYKETGLFVKSFLICIGIVVVSIIIALSFYDLSYDGQTYHMETISLLKNGWNPFWGLLPEKNELYIYINHYPKGLEIPQSTIYSMVGRIESAKATNLILLVGTFCLCVSFLLDLNRLSTYKCILLSLLAVANPVIVNQLISTYVDGQMALLLLSFLIVSVFIIKNPNLVSLILLGSIIIITANIKFNSLVYIGIFTIAFIGWVSLSKNKILINRVLYTTILSGSFAILIVGFHPYITNTIDFKHPFYPLMGSEKVDIIEANIPKGLEDKNSASRFFTSIFAHSDNMLNIHDREVEMKIPFTLNKSDILNAAKVDTRVAGFGPLFSGIIILSILLFTIFLLRCRNLKAIKGLIYIILVLAVTVFIMPDSWWARYIPQLWFIPIFILLATELYQIRLWKYFNVLKYVIYIALIVNISFTFIGFGWNFMMSRLVDYQLEILRASKQPIKVQWGICSTNYIRFQENNISFIEMDLSDREDVEEVVRSNYSIFVVDSNVNIPKSNFIKWAEKYQQSAEEQ